VRPVGRVHAPGGTHDYLEAFESLLAPEGIEFIHYDQLGSAYSVQPKDPELWTIDRLVDEVEQCAWRSAWIARTSTCTDILGGMLAIEAGHPAEVRLPLGAPRRSAALARGREVSG
jgi:hypothetical protein